METLKEAVVEASPSSTQPDAAEASRREALRKAGAEYLERALQAAKQGEDPFAVAPVLPEVSPPSATSLATTSAGGPPVGRQGSVLRSKRQQPIDPDVAAFGQFFESTKVYVYLAMYCACQATLYSLVKGSLASMKTPAVMSFLHMLSASLSLWMSRSYDIFDMQYVLTNPAAALKGCSVRAGLFGLQMLFLYGALLHSSVNMILCWLALGPALVYAAVSLTGLRPQLIAPHDAMTVPLLAVSAAATALEVVFDVHKSWLSLVLLACWSATKVLEICWRALKEDPSLGGRLADFGPVVSLVRDVSDAEDELNSHSTALLVNALPAVPILVLGLIGQEGREIVDHELSVPAVRMMLMSCAAHVGTTWSQLLLFERLSSQAKAGARAVALMAAVAFNYWEQTHTVAILASVFAFVAIAAASGLVQGRAGGRARRSLSAAVQGAVPAGGV